MSAEFERKYADVASYLRRVFLMPMLSGFADALPPSAPGLLAPKERNELGADGSANFLAFSEFIPAGTAHARGGTAPLSFFGAILRRLIGRFRRAGPGDSGDRGELLLRISAYRKQSGIEITCEVKCPTGERSRSPGIGFSIDAVDEPALSDWLVTTLPVAYQMLSTEKNRPATSAAASGPEPGAIVLGTEMAAAAAADQRWQQSGVPHESPLPANGYDFWRGDQFLVDPAPSSLDDALRAVARQYAKSDPQQRAAIRDSISMDGFYTLMTFARRSAVWAMRLRQNEPVSDGLTAITMINQQRVDFRDILVCLSLLYHAATRVGADAGRLFGQSARLAEREVGERFAQFTRQTAEYRDMKSSWGFDEVNTENGVGFIGWDFAKYNPEIDLKSVALQLCRLIAADKYQPDSVSVAAELPPVWLSRGKNAEQERVLAAVRGGASISARLRPGEHAQHDSQQFTVFIVEAFDPADAQTLLGLSQANEVREHSMTGAAAGRLFALIIARSFMVGVEAFETPASIARFEKPLAKILASSAETGAQ